MMEGGKEGDGLVLVSMGAMYKKDTWAKKSGAALGEKIDTHTLLVIMLSEFMLGARTRWKFVRTSKHLYLCESVEGFSLPTSDWAGPMLELHTVPKSASLIVGHNGRGGFGLWDLSDRVLLTKYSTFHHSFVRILPIGLCSHTITDCLGTGFEIEKIKEIIASMDMSFCGSSAQYLHQTCREGIAVWLLILAYPEEYMDRDSGGSWRLALLVKNRVLIGKTLDPRASAANVSDGKGIIGTSDGLVYMWELSTGRKLFNLHCGRGGSILHIAADAGSGVLAVAGEDCKLCFYEQSIGR